MASVPNGLPRSDDGRRMTSIAMCRQRGSIHIGPIATGTGTRNGTGQRMIDETAVGSLSFVGIQLSAATAALQPLVVAVENVSVRGIESRKDVAVDPLVVGVGLATESGTTLVNVIETVIEIVTETATVTETVTATAIEIATGTGIGTGTAIGTETETQPGTAIETGTGSEIAHHVGIVGTAARVGAVSSGIDQRVTSSGSGLKIL